MDHLSKGTRPASDKARLEPGQAPSTARVSFTNPTFWVHDDRTEKQERQAHLQGSKPGPATEVQFLKNPALELSPRPRPRCHTFPRQRQGRGPPMNMHQPDLSPLKKACFGAEVSVSLLNRREPQAARAPGGVRGEPEEHGAVPAVRGRARGQAHPHHTAPALRGRVGAGVPPAR